MNTSLKWIEALVPGLNVDAQEYTDAMILSGSKVEFYKKREIRFLLFLTADVLPVDMMER